MTTSKQNTDAMRDHFLGYLLSGDRRGGSHYIHGLLKSDFTLSDIYEHVIKESLYMVGEMWEQNRVTVAEEHLATSVSEAIMNEFFPGIVSHHRIKKRVLVGCVEQELHQVGAKMVADIFEMKGWDSYFLGANTPQEELLRFAQDLKPDVIALSASIYFHIPQLEDMLCRTRELFPDTPVLVGGQAFRHGGRDIAESYPGVQFISDLFALEKVIDMQSYGL